MALTKWFVLKPRRNAGLALIALVAFVALRGWRVVPVGVRRPLLTLPRALYGAVSNAVLHAGDRIAHGLSHGLSDAWRAFVPWWHTTCYTWAFDPAVYERRGADFTNPAFSPLRLGKPLSALNDQVDYDFDHLESIEASLRQVDRPTALRHVFSAVTRTASSETERHLLVLAFLQHAIQHGLLQPLHRDRTAVFDPLVLLELGEGACGHYARVAADLYEAAGYPSRLVQCGGHVLAEVRYDGGWHYLDADLFGNGDSVRLPDGSIPSFAALQRTPYAIDALPAWWKPDHKNRLRKDPTEYPSAYYFGRSTYTTPPLLYIKHTGLTSAQRAAFNGWNHYDTVVDPERTLQDIPRMRAPGAPVLNAVAVRRAGGRLNVDLGWSPSVDPDHLLTHYTVHVSRSSRGWGYDGASLPAAVARYQSHPEGWRPECYTARYTVPPSDVQLLTTREANAHLELPDDADYYLTVMPHDSHGESVGRRLYFVSEELRIPREAR